MSQKQIRRKRFSCHGDGNEDVVLIAPESCFEDLRDLVSRIDFSSSMIEIPDWVVEIVEAYEYEAAPDTGLRLR